MNSSLRDGGLLFAATFDGYIVTGRFATFRYSHIGGIRMTSTELKHRAKLQEWSARIQDCRSSGLSVRA